MLNRTLIGLLIALCITVPCERAFAACADVDEAIAVQSEVRHQKRGLITLISSGESKTAALLNPDFVAAHPLQAERYSNFIQKLNDADDKNSVSMTEGEIQNFVGALQVMERFWNCVEPEEISPVEVFGQSGSMAVLGEANLSGETDRIAPESAVYGQSDNRALAQNSGDLRPAKIAKPNELQVNYMVLIGMIILFIGGMVYVVRKRPKQREERRIINEHARVELAKNVFDMRIVDITANGCKIEHNDQIHSQKRLKVELNGTWHSGQIKWHNSAFAGVKFRRPIAQETFNRIVKLASA